MPIINHFKKEIILKIVYFGPALCGKTTNLININKRYVEEEVGKLITLPTETDRTIFFDLLPIKGGKIEGFNLRYQLFTVPGQVYYNATRKMVLKGVDGLVFVADSQTSMKDSNTESLANLKENLSEYGRKLQDIPLVFQWNKRDLENLLPVEKLQKELNPGNLPAFEAQAINGVGVLETFKAIRDLTKKNIEETLERERQPKEAKEKLQVELPTHVIKTQEPTAISGKLEKPISAELELVDCGNPYVVSYGFIRIPLVLRNRIHDEYYSLNLDISLTELTKSGDSLPTPTQTPSTDQGKTTKKTRPSKKKKDFYK